MTQNFIIFDPYHNPRNKKVKPRLADKPERSLASIFKSSKPNKAEVSSESLLHSPVLHKFSLAKSLIQGKSQSIPHNLPPLEASGFNLDLHAQRIQTVLSTDQTVRTHNNEDKRRSINNREFIIKTKSKGTPLTQFYSPKAGTIPSEGPGLIFNSVTKAESEKKNKQPIGDALKGKTEIKADHLENKRRGSTLKVPKNELKPVASKNKSDQRSTTEPLKTIKKPINSDSLATVDDDTIVKVDLLHNQKRGDPHFIDKGLFSLSAKDKKHSNLPTFNRYVSYGITTESGRRFYKIETADYKEGFTLDELQQENYDWDILDICLGEGTWGKVFKAYDKIKEKLFALKIMSFSGETDPRFHSGIHEAILHRRVSDMGSNNFVKLYDAYIKTEETGQKEKQLIMVLELCDCSLANIIEIRRENSIHWEEESFMKIVKDLFQACFVLFQDNIVHRDIKPHNILYSLSDRRYKLADFGEGKVISHTDSHFEVGTLSPFLNTVRGTPSFMSLELYQSFIKAESACVHSPFASDLYSLGLSLLAARVLEKKIPLEERRAKLEALDPALQSTKILQTLLAEDSAERVSLFKSQFEGVVGMLDSEASNEGSMIEIHELGLKRTATALETALKNIKIAEAYLKLFKFSKAKELLNDVIAELRAQASLSPEEKYVFSDALKVMGKLQVDIFEIDEGLNSLQQALEIRGSLFDSTHPFLGELNNEIGIAYMRKEDFPAAEKYYLKAISISIKMEGKEGIHFSHSMHNLASIYLLQKNHQKALELFQKSLDVATSVTQQADSLENSDTLNNMGTLFMEMGKFEEAEKCLKQSLSIAEKHLGSNHPSHASIFYNMAQLRNSLGKLDAETLELYQKALKLWTSVYGENYRKNIDIYNNMSIYYQKLEFSSQAIDCLQKAIEIGNAAENVGKVREIEQVKLNLGNLLLNTTGQQEKALALIFDSLENLQEEDEKAKYGIFASTYTNVGTYYAQNGDFLNAEKYLSQARGFFQRLGTEEAEDRILKIDPILNEAKKVSGK